MEVKKAIVSNLILVGVLTVNTFANAADTKPYCAAANDNTHWWTWTAENMESACYTAMIKTFESGKHINTLFRGHYSVNGLNKANLRCQEGKRKVIGQGSEVFTSAANMRSQLGWKKGCEVIVKE